MTKNEKIDKYYKELKHSYINIKHLSQYLLRNDNSVMDEALNLIGKKIKGLKKLTSKEELDKYIKLEKMYSKYGKEVDKLWLTIL